MCQQKPKQPRRRGFSPGASPGVLESLPGTGFGTGATLIGALVTSTLGFCAVVGSLYHGWYCRCGAEYVGPAAGGGGGGGGGGAGGFGFGLAALAGVGGVLLGVGDATVGRFVCDSSAVVLGLRKTSQPPHTTAAMTAAAIAAAAGFFRYQCGSR